MTDSAQFIAAIAIVQPWRSDKHDNPLALCLVARSLLPGVHAPCRSHRFVRALEERGKLLRGYTENIDGLEAQAGVSREALVEAHGTFASARCVACGA